MPYDLRQTRARTRGRSGREVSGQYRVTVPDPDALDRLRMQNRVYDRTLMPRDLFTGSVPVGYAHYQARQESHRQNRWIRTRGRKLRAKSWKAYTSQGVGYTLTPRGIHQIPTPLAHCQVQEGRARVEGQ